MATPHQPITDTARLECPRWDDSFQVLCHSTWNKKHYIQYVEQHTLLHKKEEVKNKWLGLGGVSDVIMGGGERHYLSLQGGYKPLVPQAIPVEALEPPPRRHKDDPVT